MLRAPEYLPYVAPLHPNAPTETPASALVVGAGRPADVVAFEAEVVAFFVEAAASLGVPKSVAAIYGMCFAAPKPLGFAELEARLALSKGSISQGLKVLREVGALTESATADPRTKSYVPNTELRQLVGQLLETRVSRQLQNGHRRLVDLKRMLAVYPGTGQRPLRARISKLERWHERTRALLPVAKTFLRLGG